MMKSFSTASLKKLLYNKNFLLPFSLVLSFIIWLSIAMGQQETIQRTFSGNTVSINLENTAVSENKMSIIGDISEQKFTVVVRGHSGIVSRLTASDISLYASAAEVDSPGKYSLKVSALKASETGDYEVLSISPPTIDVTFDYVDTKEFTITPSTESITVVESGIVKGTEVIGGVETATVSITGPRTIISKIEKVTAEVKETKTITQSETFDAEFVLYDVDGRELSKNNLSFSATDIKVTVPVYKQKTVPVVATFSNAPDGFSKDALEIIIDHSEVVIEGIPEMVEKIDKIELSPIDLSLLTKGNSQFVLTPKLPEGIRIFDSIESFNVSVNIENYSEKTITVSNFKYEGLESGLKVSGTSEIKNVKICAPKAVINRIRSESAYAKIVLSEKKAGEHTVTVLICFEGYDSVWAVGSYKTTLTIK